MNPDGSTCHKARLVVKGYHQVKEIDYKERYAPVSQPASLHTLLSFASINHWSCDHMDVVTAFLHPEIDQTDVLMNLSEFHGLGDLSEFNLNAARYQTVWLRKALYGLKQSLRLWYKEIDSFLKSLSFRQSTEEPNLYLTKNIIILL